MIESGSVDFKWLFGMAGTFVLALIGAFRHLSGKASAGDKVLHDKVDEIKKDYVRRDDYREDRNENKEQFKSIQEKLDRLIARG